MDAISTARYGMLAASRHFEDAANRTVAAGSGDGDLVSGVVDIVQAKTAFAASAKVARIADEMWDALLNIQRR